jgi:hypothetical protein
MAKTYDLESYVPEAIRIDNEVLAYTDFMNKVKVLDHGKLEDGCDRIVVEFSLSLDVIVSDVSLNTPRIYHKGRFY